MNRRWDCRSNKNCSRQMSMPEFRFLFCWSLFSREWNYFQHRDNISSVFVQKRWNHKSKFNRMELKWIEWNEMNWNDSVEIAAYAKRSIEIFGLIVTIAYWWANFSLINDSIFNLLKFNCSIDILEISLCSNKTFIFFSHSENAYLSNARRMFRIFLIRIAIEKKFHKKQCFFFSSNTTPQCVSFSDEIDGMNSKAKKKKQRKQRK